MDPISLIVSALVMGAAAGLKPTVEKAIKDSYEGIKNLIKSRYPGVNVQVVEGDPKSASRQEILKEDLEKNQVAKGADGKDQDLLLLAQKLVELVKEKDPQTAASVGISISGNAQVQAGYMGGRDVTHTETRRAGRDYYESRDQSHMVFNQPAAAADDLPGLINALKDTVASLNLPEREQKLVKYELEGASLGAEGPQPDLDAATLHLNQAAQIARKATPGGFEATPFGLALAKLMARIKK